MGGLGPVLGNKGRGKRDRREACATSLQKTALSYRIPSSEKKPSIPPPPHPSSHSTCTMSPHVVPRNLHIAPAPPFHKHTRCSPCRAASGSPPLVPAPWAWTPAAHRSARQAGRQTPQHPEPPAAPAAAGGGQAGLVKVSCSRVEQALRGRAGARRAAACMAWHASAIRLPGRWPTGSSSQHGQPPRPTAAAAGASAPAAAPAHDIPNLNTCPLPLPTAHLRHLQLRHALLLLQNCPHPQCTQLTRRPLPQYSPPPTSSCWMQSRSLCGAHTHSPLPRK